MINDNDSESDRPRYKERKKASRRACLVENSDERYDEYCSKKSYNAPAEISKKEVDINEKLKIMEMIKTQDFINGYWEENKYTKIVKDIYQEEYD